MAFPVSAKTVLFTLFFGLVFAAVRGADVKSGPQAPLGLRCEYLVDPMGIDVRAPRFSWIPGHGERGQAQTAFQVQVGGAPGLEQADAWDTGKVAPGSALQTVYAGKPLASGRTYYWRVRFWDAGDQASPWSEPARFDTGLFRREEWKGVWIGGGNQLRREFKLEGKPVRGRAYVCGLGYHELRINGLKVGADVLDPGWTTFDKRALYGTHDVTPFLREGENVVGVILGQGWFKSRALLFQMNVELEGGAGLSLAGDVSWQAAAGPILQDSLYDGETYDARRETPGWDRPGFSGPAWAAAVPVPGPKGALSAQMLPPIRVMDTIVPPRMTQPRPGVYVFDMGQNFSGWARLRVRGPRGAAVTMRFAEILYESGMINRENLRSARAEDVYVLKGGEEEFYEPRFTYHGFRYVELTGFPGVPTAETLRGRVVHSSVASTGSFSCSKPLLNDLQRLIVWGQKTNLHSVPTDCDQRDERMGWMGDAQGTAEEALMNFDMAAFYTKFVRDIRDVQGEDGTITDTVPHIWGGRPADPAWGTAYPLLCWYMYLYLGDTRILEEHYDGLRRYVEFLRSRAVDGLVRFSSYGDWVAVDKTPGDIVSSFYYYYDVKVLAEAAKVLGRGGDARDYARLAGEIKSAFHKAYFDPRTGDYANGTQTANTLALFLDLAPEAARGAAWGNLFDNIAYKNASHLTTGIIGTKYIMEVLDRFGASDLAYDIAVQTSYPGWGWMIANGATTLWELWQKREGPSMNSHNHPMFGSVGAWLYKTLAGIVPDETGPGFARLRIAPRMVRDLTHASASIESVRGRIASSWSRSANSIALAVEVPFGSEAEIVIPKFQLRDVAVREGGRVIWDGKKAGQAAPGIRDIREDDAAVTLKAGSGRYAFELTGV